MFWPFRSRTTSRPDDGSSPSPEELDDTRLISRARQGDSHAFGVLYERYLNSVYRYVAYRTMNTATAEDLTSEVFLNAWKSIDRYEDRGYAFSTWLLRLAHNEVTDYYRTHHHNATLPETDVYSSSTNDPGQLVELQSDQTALLNAIRQLPDEWQQIILLRFVEEISFEEIGIIVGKSSGACRVIQHRALGRLRQLLTLEEKFLED
jgi:RNA polymerase sigma-70 factor (ECF subfamily)